MSVTIGTIYISGQITGNTKYIEQFNEAEKMLKEYGYLVLNPVKLCEDIKDNYVACMKRDILALLMCNEIYMLKGWQYSKGAIIEYIIARVIGIDIIYEENNYNKFILFSRITILLKRWLMNERTY